MKVKTKGILTGILFTVLIGLLALFIAFVPQGTSTASAETTPKYVVAFDYSANYTYGTGGGVSNYPSSGMGVYSATFRHGATGSNTVTVSMYGSSTSGTGSFTRGDYIASSYVTVEVNSTSCKITVTIKNSSGTKMASGTNKVSASGLSEGTYTVSMLGSGSGTINSRAYWSSRFDGSFTFKIDQNAPTINGASTSTTGKKVNTAFTVSAFDSGSGVKALYMKAPNNSSFYSVGTSTTVNRGSANGRYTFYAEDNGGNKSGYYYVNFDDTPPTINCSGASFGSNTNAAFTVKAEDNTGSVTLYRKTGDGGWTASGTSYTVSNSSEDNTYYFYAQDLYGNKSSEQWVQLGAELSGEFVKSNTDNSVYFTWDRPNWTATLDGSPYSKGMWIRQEGEHIIKLSSGTKSAVYPYTIDHCYVESIENPTCTEIGYLQYDCIQCGDTYTNYSIEETGHYYVASTTVATCTSGGYTVYTCTRCGDRYTDNYTNPLGHNYEATYMPATCTDYGKTVFTCQVCGSGYYETDGTYPKGHNYTSTIIKAPTCTEEGLRRSVCDDCGDSYDTVIAANGHNYAISDSVSENDITTRTYTCTYCSHSYKQELGDQYEEVGNYVEYLFKQYSPYMWWVLLATAGVWSIVMGVFFAIAQKNEDKEKSKKMIVNYVIGLVVIAIIVVACPYLISGIASL